jgi:hypothetical protein
MRITLLLTTRIFLSSEAFLASTAAVVPLVGAYSVRTKPSIFVVTTLASQDYENTTTSLSQQKDLLNTPRKTVVSKKSEGLSPTPAPKSKYATTALTPDSLDYTTASHITTATAAVKQEENLNSSVARVVTPDTTKSTAVGVVAEKVESSAKKRISFFSDDDDGFLDLCVPPAELRASATLTTGQCFHWKAASSSLSDGDASDDNIPQPQQQSA